MYYAIFGIVVFAAFAMSVQQGLWNNLLKLVQITLSGLLAFAYYQPLTILIDEATKGEYTYYLDFVVLWLLYSLLFVILNLVGTSLSKTRVKFLPPLDSSLGPFVGLMGALALGGFTMATLHTAPLGKNTFGGHLNYYAVDVESGEDSKTFNEPPILQAPDYAWLRLVESLSDLSAWGGTPLKVEDFTAIYKDHRSKYEATSGFKVQR